MLPAFDIPVHRHSNNASLKNYNAIALAVDPVSHDRSKHIDIRHQFMRKRVNEGNIQRAHIPGEQNIADLFTKQLPRDLSIKDSDALLYLPVTGIATSGSLTKQ